MSHSPAPWKFVASIYDDDDMLSTNKEVPYDYRSGNFCYNPSIVDADGNEVVGCDEYNVFSTPENVRLLVHAPELLGALKELTERYKKVMSVSSDGWVNMANQVIAKAEGKERSIYCQLDENSYCTHCSGHEHLCRQAIAKAEGAL